MTLSGVVDSTFSGLRMRVVAWTMMLLWPLAATAGDSLEAALGVERQPNFYLSSIMGGSFATIAQPDLPPGSPSIGSQPLATGGFAAGLSFDRPRGSLRVEFEGRAREKMQVTESDPFVGSLMQGADDGWSSMANLWRQFDFGDRFGAYLGVGIGAGGYRYFFSGDSPGATISGSTGITSFAWQAGGGLTWKLSERVELDVGYRFFEIAPGAAELVVTTATGTIRDQVNTAFSAGEALVTLRLYEPFRALR